jgi:hypothetical protein
MYVDNQLIFHGTGFGVAGQGAAITVSACSAKCLDRTDANNDILDGETLYAMVSFSDSFTTGDGATGATIDFRSATALDLTTGAIVHTSRAFLIAAMVLNKTFCIGAIKVPPKTQRYLGFYTTLAGGTFNAGKATFWLARDVQGNIGGQLG